MQLKNNRPSAEKEDVMQESSSVAPAAFGMPSSFFLAAGTASLCIGVALLLFAPRGSLLLTAGLLCAGAAFLLLAFSKQDRQAADKSGRPDRRE